MPLAPIPWPFQKSARHHDQFPATATTRHMSDSCNKNFQQDSKNKFRKIKRSQGLGEELGDRSRTARGHWQACDWAGGCCSCDCNQLNVGGGRTRPMWTERVALASKWERINSWGMDLNTWALFWKCHCRSSGVTAGWKGARAPAKLWLDFRNPAYAPDPQAFVTGGSGNHQPEPPLLLPLSLSCAILQLQTNLYLCFSRAGFVLKIKKNKLKTGVPSPKPSNKITYVFISNPLLALGLEEFCTHVFALE